jgi:transposase
MGKNKTLSPTKRAKIVALNETGMTQRCIADKVGVSKTAVQQALAKFAHAGTYRDAPRSGRPKKTTIRDDRIIRKFVSANPKASISVIKVEMETYGISLSKSTISRTLRKMDLGSYRSAKKPFLTPRMHSQRLAFAKKFVSWTPED